MTDVVDPFDTRLRTAGADDALAEWLRLSSTGDQAAFARVYDTTASRTFGLALRVLGDRATAEDVIQETYLHVWTHSGRFDPSRGRPMSWILMIAHGRAVSRIRSESARAQREERARHRDHPVESGDHDETHDAVASSLEARRVRELVAQIPEAQRTAVELAYLDGLTYAEVARHTGVPLGTAKTRIRTGLRSLRDLLDLPRDVDRSPGHRS